LYHIDIWGFLKQNRGFGIIKKRGTAIFDNSSTNRVIYIFLSTSKNGRQATQVFHGRLASNIFNHSIFIMFNKDVYIFTDFVVVVIEKQNEG